MALLWATTRTPCPQHSVSLEAPSGCLRPLPSPLLLNCSTTLHGPSRAAPWPHQGIPTYPASRQVPPLCSLYPSNSSSLFGHSERGRTCLLGRARERAANKVPEVPWRPVLPDSRQDAAGRGGLWSPVVPAIPPSTLAIPAMLPPPLDPYLRTLPYLTYDAAPHLPSSHPQLASHPISSSSPPSAQTPVSLESPLTWLPIHS